MSKNRHNNNKAENAHKHQTNAAEEAAEIKDVLDDTSAEETDETETEAANVELQNQLEAALADVEKEKKEYMFLMADFDNFRKRTLKEKSELIKNGGENAMRGLLPIIDDFERSLQAINESSDAMAIKEGVELIYNKFTKYLEQNGVKPIASEPGSDFDTEIHEAVTMFPTDNPDQKGKVIDTVQKGYTLNDKVIRHAKVVVGQ